jgi:hypothetical protein
MPPIMGEDEGAQQEDLAYIGDIEVDYEQEEDVEEYLEDRRKRDDRAG